MIDSDGFRPNVGIILSNDEGKLLWAKRIGQNAWQFPQGGIQEGESPEDALFRELAEEVGLTEEHVEILGSTERWLRYRLPRRFIRQGKKPLCIGQKQKWFILRLTADETKVRFDTTESPEFDGWRWVDYWYPIRDVVFFKRDVYRRALQELSEHLPEEVRRDRPRRSRRGWRFKHLKKRSQKKTADNRDTARDQ